MEPLEEASAYRFMHDRSYKKFASLHMYFSLPVIIISTIAGTANFATGSFPESLRAYVSLATGGLGLIASMITTVGQFMKIPEMILVLKYLKYIGNLQVTTF